MALYRKYCRVMVYIGICAFILASGAKIAEAGIVNGGDTAMQVLQLFCKYDFFAEESAVDYVRVSPEYRKLHEATSDNEPLSLSSDPMVIVSTYHVSSVQLNGNFATGKVMFERLAYTRGSGNDVNYNPTPREIIQEYNESEEVEFTLKKINGRWYVYDPPVMRVSLAVIVKHYRELVPPVIQDDFWIDLEFSNAQRKNIANNFFNAEVLMQISVDYLKRLEARYKDIGGPDYPDKERQQRVKLSYTGKWNVVVATETI